ncbi:MAG TPA: diacylglycerol/polyprenol kinase family protein [Allocoleopsis sp.]
MFNSLFSLSSIPSTWLQIMIVGGYVTIIVLIAEFINRYNSTDPERIRKIVHIGTGNVILLFWWLKIPDFIAISASIIAAIIALLSYKFNILPGINSIGRQSLGTFFYAVSIGVLVALFSPLNQVHYTVLGILIMTWGDGLAALIGQKFGKHKYEIFGIKKSWEGSLTMLFVSFMISNLILFSVGIDIIHTLITSLIVAIIATILEAFSKLGLDNLTVPLGSAILAFYLQNIW